MIGNNDTKEGEDIMRKKGKNGIAKAAAMVLAGMLLTGTANGRVYAAQDYTVTAQKTIMYTGNNVVVYAAPDLQSQIVTSISYNLPVEVTGVTSNGWYQINLKGTYYVQADKLKEKADDTVLKSYQADEITKLTKGTFSLFTGSELRAFLRDDVEAMDANTYIKYLDSFLMGNSVLENCILVDSELTLKEEYEGKAAADSKVAAITMKDYLVNYRNEYLENSYWGPVRTQEELMVTLNRAIRYGDKEFSTVYKNAVVGSESTKMESVLEEVIADIKAEQGVTFQYKKDYGTFQNDAGTNTSGWIIEFTRK